MKMSSEYSHLRIQRFIAFSVAIVSLVLTVGAMVTLPLAYHYVNQLRNSLERQFVVSFLFYISLARKTPPKNQCCR